MPPSSPEAPTRLGGPPRSPEPPTGLGGPPPCQRLPRPAGRAATAACFAGALHAPYGGDGSLPGAPGPGERAERADAPADRTEDPETGQLAEAVRQPVRQADRLA
ncbi:hypothetical protein [Streptomyces sp. WG5]|uniref:hypothetical protein n=1 Tax=Streptomyces sp. WG5 TaxID=3417648 RepID=UPI003CE90AD5